MSGHNAHRTPVLGAEGEMDICMCIRMARLEEFQLPFFFLTAQHKCYLSESALNIYSELSNFSHIFPFFSKVPDVTQWNKQNFRNSDQPQNRVLPSYADISQALRIIIGKITASINQGPFNPGMRFISVCSKKQWYSLPYSFRLPYSSK